MYDILSDEERKYELLSYLKEHGYEASILPDYARGAMYDSRQDQRSALANADFLLELLYLGNVPPEVRAQLAEANESDYSNNLLYSFNELE